MQMKLATFTGWTIPLVFLDYMLINFRFLPTFKIIRLQSVPANVLHCLCHIVRTKIQQRQKPTYAQLSLGGMIKLLIWPLNGQVATVSSGCRMTILTNSDIIFH